MCKLIVGVSDTDNNKAFSTAIELQYDELKAEKDGVAALIVDKQGKQTVLRSMKEYDDIFKQTSALLPTARLVCLHTRTGTSGAKTLENVHLFEDRGVLFAHNGFIQAYHKAGLGFSFGEGVKTEMRHFPAHVQAMSVQDIQKMLALCNGCATASQGICKRHKVHSNYIQSLYETEEKALMTFDSKDNVQVIKTEAGTKCDSFQFLTALPKPYKKGDIYDMVEDKRFSGMAFLFEREKNIGQLIVKKAAYSISDNKSFGLFFSYEPSVEETFTTYDSIYGVNVITGERTRKIKNKPRDIIQGIYDITPKVGAEILTN